MQRCETWQIWQPQNRSPTSNPMGLDSICALSYPPPTVTSSGAILSDVIPRQKCPTMHCTENHSEGHIETRLNFCPIRDKIQETANSSTPGYLGDEVRNKRQRNRIFDRGALPDLQTLMLEHHWTTKRRACPTPVISTSSFSS
ncbi:hypothetical protein TNCV_4485501 [Trichonephila clavipes]|nr:hypothetical protein TNCV_4485501 [Trichonephila clavipes]